MRILIDTHIAVWFWNTDRRMTPRLLSTLTDPENEVVFSQVSTLELQLKHQKGTLVLPDEPELFIPNAIAQAGFTYQFIQDRWIFFLQSLPMHHKDPFDRLLISQAIIEGSSRASRLQQMTPGFKIIQSP